MELQVRLPDGTVWRSTCQSATLLQAVAAAVAQHLHLPSIALGTAFPRRVFQEAEMQQPLGALRLGRRCVLLAEKPPDADGGLPRMASGQDTAFGEEHEPSGGEDDGEGEGEEQEQEDNEHQQQPDNEEEPDAGFAVPQPPWAALGLAVAAGFGPGHALGDAAGAPVLRDRRAVREQRLRAMDLEGHATPGRAAAGPLLRSVPSLRSLCFSQALRRVHATDRPIVYVNRVDSSIAEELVHALALQQRLTAKTLSAFRSTALSRLQLQDYPHASDDLLKEASCHGSLEQIALVRCTTLTRHGLDHLLHLPRLSTLVLDSCRLQDAALPTLACLAQLRQLQLSHMPLSDGAVARFLRAKNLQQLTGLDLTGCAEVGKLTVASAGQLPALRSLNLRGTAAAGVDALAAAAPLQWLNLGLTRSSSSEVGRRFTGQDGNIPPCYVPWGGGKCGGV
jgi:hypothetical protein